MNAIACPGCASSAPATAKFCPRCGTALLVAPAPGAYAPPPAQPPAPAVWPDTSSPTPGQRRWPFLVVGALVVAGGALLAWFLLFSGASGGSSDPEAAVRDFVDAVNGDDPFLIVQAIAPSEVDGTADLLRELQDSLSDQGVETWDSDDSSFDITIDLDSADVVDSASSAALVEVDGTINIDGIDLPAPFGAIFGDSYSFDLADAADTLDDRGVDELTVATVKEDGGWYVSPMMTAATIGAGLADLPGPDLDRFDGEVERVAESAEEAVETAIESAVRLDLDELITVVSPSVSRLLMAFEDTLDELERDADEEGYDVSRFRIDTTEVASNEYGIDEVHVVASTFGDSAEVRVTDDCIEVDGDVPDCLLDSFPADLQHEQVVVHTAKVDGGYVVDPLASLTAVASDFVQQLDYEWVLAAADVAVADSPVPVAVGVETDVDFDGRPYVVVEFTPNDDEHVRLSVFGDAGRSSLYVEDEEGLWRSWNSYGEPADGSTLRAVVNAPTRSCGPLFCDRDTNESVSIVAHSALAQTLVGPNQIVSAELARGDGYVFTFDVSEAVSYEYTVDQGDVSISLWRDGEIQVESRMEPGTYQLEVWNTSDATTSFVVTPRLLDGGAAP